MTGPGTTDVRAYRPGDEGALNSAFNRVFGRDRSLSEWAWKFPVGAEGRFIMLAVRKGEILAQYAGVPVRFGIDDAQWTATQIVDAFATREALRGLGRHGLFTSTVERYFDEFGRSGLAPLLFGFPGPRHRRLGILQLGYDSMEPQPVTYLSRTAGAAAHSGRRLFYRAELARDWEPRLDVLWARVRDQYPVAVVRDAGYAVRRYAGRPGVRYHRFVVFPRWSSVPVAYVVYRLEADRLRWADLLWDHGHPGALDLAAHLAQRLTTDTGARLEDMWLNGDPEGRHRLERLGFEAGPEPQDLVMVARAFDPGVDVEALATRGYVTLGDSDLV